MHTSVIAGKKPIRLNSKTHVGILKNKKNPLVTRLDIAAIREQHTSKG